MEGSACDIRPYDQSTSNYHIYHCIFQRERVRIELIITALNDFEVVGWYLEFICSRTCSRKGVDCVGLKDPRPFQMQYYSYLLCYVDDILFIHHNMDSYPNNYISLSFLCLGMAIQTCIWVLSCAGQDCVIKYMHSKWVLQSMSMRQSGIARLPWE